MKVNSGRMREDEARRYFQQLINAVDYCHSRGVYHRDLKVLVMLLHVFRVSFVYTWNYILPYKLASNITTLFSLFLVAAREFALGCLWNSESF